MSFIHHPSFKNLWVYMQTKFYMIYEMYNKWDITINIIIIMITTIVITIIFILWSLSKNIITSSSSSWHQNHHLQYYDICNNEYVMNKVNEFLPLTSSSWLQPSWLSSSSSHQNEYNHNHHNRHHLLHITISIIIAIIIIIKTA